MRILLETLGWQNLRTWQIAVLFSPILLNLWAIRHAFYHNFPGKYERLIWAYVTIFLPVLGGLAYIFFGRKRAIKL